MCYSMLLLVTANSAGLAEDVSNPPLIATYSRGSPSSSAVAWLCVNSSKWLWSVLTHLLLLLLLLLLLYVPALCC
jgi:hypothetical protein